MIEEVIGLQSYEALPSLGVNELVSVTQVPAQGFIYMNNWRYSRDGSRIEKRGGLSTQVDLSAGAKAIYGYATYYNASAVFCEIVVTSAAVWRKVGSGSLTSIHTWTTALAHPVNILEINNRIYILTEIDNIMLLSDGTKVQVGITAPATIPTVAATYDATLLDEDCAAITDWTSGDLNSGVSSQATFDSKSCMRLLGAASAGSVARRYRTITNLGPKYSAEFSIYFDTLGSKSESDYFGLKINNGRIAFELRVDGNDVYINSAGSYTACGATIYKDRWLRFAVLVDTAETGTEWYELFIDDKSVGRYFCDNADTTNVGRVLVEASGVTTASDVYIDYIKIGQTDGGQLIGRYRYAVAYRRSGNYGDVSNPIKSLIGAVTFVGSGLNDLTLSGTYTGDRTRNFRVYVDGVGTPNTFKWSEDNGTTWNSVTASMAAEVAITWGVTLKFAATTGHTATEYWNFTASAISTVALQQKVTVSSIPVSSDAQVDTKDVYRTSSGGSVYYLVATIPNAQTTFVDNLPDSFLGIDMKEDRAIAPKGKYSSYWDDRLWIADEDENIIYYSDINFPEAFDLTSRYISVRQGESDDEITGMIVYKGYLYPFKRKSILILRKKASGAYGRFSVCRDFGCIAPWSLNETFGLLTFLSFRGWEVFNGCEGFSNQFGLMMDRTLQTVDKTYLERISAVTNLRYNEIILSLPNRTGGESAITLACNYLKGQCFYTFSYSKTPSWFGQVRNSSGDLKLYMGTTDGYVLECDSGTQDITTNITARGVTGYVRHEVPQYFLHFECEYEAPTAITLSAKIYTDFDKDVKRTVALAGATPSATDIELRRPIKNKGGMSISGQFSCVELYNAENVGAALKVNSFKVFHAPVERREQVKGD